MTDDDEPMVYVTDGDTGTSDDDNPSAKEPTK